jgi:hypothetical protein
MPTDSFRGTAALYTGATPELTEFGMMSPTIERTIHTAPIVRAHLVSLWLGTKRLM